MDSLPQTVLPRHATPRNPDRPSYGPAIARTAKLLGWPLMPWQDGAADVAGEVDPATGRFSYSLVVISVPRQSGKTTLGQASSVHRCLYKPRRKVWHTAQTGQIARDKWREMVEESVLRSPLGPHVSAKFGAGDSRLIFPHGSQLRPFPPTVDALHGEQSDKVDIDEGWAFTEAQGHALTQAIEPTQATRTRGEHLPGPQTWIYSTMGDASSTWFHDLVGRAREGDPRICLIEYGIPDDVDPTELAEVARYHPAIGHTIGIEALESAAAKMTPSEFARGYGNRSTKSRERLITTEAWDGVLSTEPLPDGPPCFGVAVAHDMRSASIVAALERAGMVHAEVIEHRPGWRWAIPRARELHARWSEGATVLAVDPVGPAQSIADALARADVPIHTATAADATLAFQEIWTRLHPDPGERPGLAIIPHPALDAAIDVAARRQLGDRWVWDRRNSAGPIDTLEALSLAALLAARPTACPEPMMRI